MDPESRSADLPILCSPKLYFLAHFLDRKKLRQKSKFFVQEEKKYENE